MRTSRSYECVHICTSAVCGNVHIRSCEGVGMRACIHVTCNMCTHFVVVQQCERSPVHYFVHCACACERAR